MKIRRRAEIKGLAIPLILNKILRDCDLFWLFQLTVIASVLVIKLK